MNVRAFTTIGTLLFCVCLLLPSPLFAAKGTNGWHWPTGAESESDYIGFLDWNALWNGGAWHLGQDFKASLDSPVYAIADGDLVSARTDVGGFGADARNQVAPGGAVILKHSTADGVSFYALYGHLKNLEPEMQRTGKVQAGQRIGDIGPWINGWHHLHFGINVSKSLPANPYRGYVGGSKNSRPTAPEQTFGWVDPVGFLKSNRSPEPAQGITDKIQEEAEKARDDAIDAATDAITQKAIEEAEKQAESCAGTLGMIALGACLPAGRLLVRRRKSGL